MENEDSIKIMNCLRKLWLKLPSMSFPTLPHSPTRGAPLHPDACLDLFMLRSLSPEYLAVGDLREQHSHLSLWGVKG